jgi:hypothetical protein
VQHDLGRDALNHTLIELGSAPCPFLEPELLSFGLGQVVEAGEQLLGQEGAFLDGEGQGFAADLIDAHGSHGSTGGAAYSASMSAPPQRLPDWFW